MVLPPHVRAEQVVQAGDPRPPRDLAGRLQPLRMLVEHRVDDVDERLVAAEQAVPAGQQVALEPALAGVLGQDLHHPARGARCSSVVRISPANTLSVTSYTASSRLDAVSSGPKIRKLLGVVAHHVDEVRPPAPGSARGSTRPARSPRRRGRGSPAAAAVVSRPPLACGLALIRRSPGGRQRARAPTGRAVVVEELLGAVGPHPLLELRPVLVVLAGAGERHLVGAPRAFDRHAVDHGGPVQPFGVTSRIIGHGRRSTSPSSRAARQISRIVSCAWSMGRGHLPVHVGGLVALDGETSVPVAAQQALELVAVDARRDGRVGDLVAVEVQDRQHRAVVHRVDELVGVPATRPAGRSRTRRRRRPRRPARSGLSMAAPYAWREDVAELAALVDRAGRLGRDVAGDAAGEGELAEEPRIPSPSKETRDRLAVGALELGVGDRRRSAVAGPGEEDRVDVALADQPVEVGRRRG